MSVLPTGVPGLDAVLDGGLPQSSSVLVIGAPGSGKTTLALQACFHTAAAGSPVCFVTTTSEPPDRLLEHARSYEFFDEAPIGRTIFLLSLYKLLGEGLDPVRRAIETEVRERRPALLVIDGLMTLQDLNPDAPGQRLFLFEMGALAAANECVLLVTTSRGADAGDRHHAEFTITDALLKLTQSIEGAAGRRHLQVVKLRGRSPLPGLHTVRLDATGMRVYPRFETEDVTASIGLDGHQARRAVGLVELDEMMDDGLPAGSIGVAAGATGTGKTLLSLHFLQEGLRSGQRGLLISLRETPAEIITRARGFGLDLAAPMSEGRLEIAHYPIVDLDVDQFVYEIRELMDRSAFERAVLEGVIELLEAVPEPGRRTALVQVVSGLLRARGITALMPVQVPQAVGPELDLGSSALASAAQNLILLRYVEHRGELYRVLSILKMRDSAFDSSIRQYTIDRAGMHVLSRSDTAEGLLSALAHRRSESRVKRSRPQERTP